MVQKKDVPMKKDVQHLAETDGNSVTEKSISKGSESEIPQTNPNAKTDSLGNNIEDSNSENDLEVLDTQDEDEDGPEDDEDE